MHGRIKTCGLMVAVCGAFGAGCGDDDDDLRRMVVAAAGSGGAGGTGGASSVGGSGNNTGGSGGSGGGAATAFPPSCSGCVELNVAITPGGASRQAQFLFRPMMPVNMTTTTITWTVKAVTPASEIPPEQMYVAPFAQNGMALDYAGYYAPQVPLTAANGFTSPDAWVEVVLDIAALGGEAPAGSGGDAGVDGGVDAAPPVTAPPPIPAGFDRAQIFQYGLYVGATAAFTGTGTVRVAVDSVTYTGGDFTDVTFTAGAENLTLDQFMLPPGSALVPRP